MEQTNSIPPTIRTSLKGMNCFIGFIMSWRFLITTRLFLVSFFTLMLTSLSQELKAQNKPTFNLGLNYSYHVFEKTATADMFSIFMEPYQGGIVDISVSFKNLRFEYGFGFNYVSLAQVTDLSTNEGPKRTTIVSSSELFQSFRFYYVNSVTLTSYYINPFIGFKYFMNSHNRLATRFIEPVQVSNNRTIDVMTYDNFSAQPVYQVGLELKKGDATRFYPTFIAGIDYFNHSFYKLNDMGQTNGVPSTIRLSLKGMGFFIGLRYVI